MTSFKSYIKIARLDNWFKNVFILPGFIIAFLLSPAPHVHLLQDLLLGMVATCFVCSANYVMNEWLDRKFDRFHPVKKLRPSVTTLLDVRIVMGEYILLVGVGLAIASVLSKAFLFTEIALLFMGLIYNVEPFRSKDRVYFDVLTESINNPLRLLLGWFIVGPPVFPPSSLMLTYWMAGAFLMAVKRYSEYRFIGNPEIAGEYRKSFKYYNEEKLLVSSLFYAVCSAFFGGVFLIKYKIELFLTFPFYALMFAWYFHIGLKPDSAAQHPEHMFKEKHFLIFVGLVSIFTVACLMVRIPQLNPLLDRIHFGHAGR